MSSDPIARQQINDAVRAKLQVGGKPLSVASLQAIRRELGLDGVMVMGTFKRALMSLKYCPDHRIQEACFSLMDATKVSEPPLSHGPRPARPHAYVLTRLR